MKSLPRLFAFVLTCHLAAPWIAAQCGGNGANAALDLTPPAIGTTLTLTVAGGPGQPFGIFLSGGVLPVAIPGIGNVCIDVTSPAFGALFTGALPAGGAAAFPIGIPGNPALLSLIAFLQAVVIDPMAPGGIGLTQAYRVDFENPDSYVALPPLTTARALGTCSRLRDGRVLVAGGGSGTLLAPQGTSSADLFDPLTRSIAAAPAMASSRAFHTATTLLDGRVLVCGGVVDTLGNVTPTCELFVPGTGVPPADAWMPAASMNSARAGHTATRLGDGRVLVAGGTTTFNATTIGPVLNGALTTGEVYDPATNAWTPVGNVMASKRFAAAATRLADGRVLVTSGINGATNIIFVGDVPTWTTTCSYYNPATNLFSAAPSLGTGRVAHAASTLASGAVWVTGGAVAGILSVPTATSSTSVLGAGAGAWSGGPTLPAAVAVHPQVLLQTGPAQIFGGATGTLLAPSAVANVVRYDGTTLSNKASLPAPAGVQVAVTLEDGTVLIAGGADSSGSAVANALLYTPDP